MPSELIGVCIDWEGKALPYCWCSRLSVWLSSMPPVMKSQSHNHIDNQYFCHTEMKKHWPWHFNLLRPSNTYICISDLTIIVSDKVLSPGRRQAIIWITVGMLLIGKNFSEIIMEIHTSTLKKMQLKMLSVKRWPFCLSLNVLTLWDLVM